jgi:hypothetical protein
MSRLQAANTQADAFKESMVIARSISIMMTINILDHVHTVLSAYVLNIIIIY